MPGRNDPCPCGSGKKYKKCCLGADAPAAGPAAAAPPDPAEFEQHVRNADKLAQSGALAESVEHYEKALGIMPRAAGVLAALARVKAQLGQVEQALDLGRRAVSVDPRNAVTHLTMACLTQDRGDLGEAIRHAERAAKADPHLLAAHQVLAFNCEKANRLDRAAAAVEAALALDPDNAQTKVVQATLARRAGDLETARRILEEVEGHYTPDKLPSWAAHELGVVRDRLGDFDGAFRAFARCGRDHRSSPLARRLDEDAQGRLIRGYREGRRTGAGPRWTAADLGDGLPAPAFLVGFPRSGTTLTEQVLSAHPDLVSIEEQGAVGRMVHDLLRDRPPGTTVPAVLEALSLDDARRLRADYWKTTRSNAPSKKAPVILDKHPLNLIHAGLINVLFPEAKLLVLIRDPRDACLSCFMQDFGLNSAMIHFLTLEGTVAFYEQVMGLWLEVRDTLAVDRLEMRYEDLVADFEPNARRLVSFFGLEWDDRVLRFNERDRKRAVATPSYEAVTEKVYTRAVGRWRNYATQMKPVLGPLERFVKELRYDGDEPRDGDGRHA